MYEPYLILQKEPSTASSSSIPSNWASRPPASWHRKIEPLKEEPQEEKEEIECWKCIVNRTLESIYKRNVLDEKEQDERMTRVNKFIQELETILKDFNAKFTVFGSAAFGCALKGSDVDINIEADLETKEEEECKEATNKQEKKWGKNEPDSTREIKLLQRIREKAKTRSAVLINTCVPLLRVELDLESHKEITVDLTLKKKEEDIRGLVKMQKELIAQTDGLKEVVVLLKVFMRNLGLHKTFKGGLNGNSCFIMANFALKRGWRERNKSEDCQEPHRLYLLIMRFLECLSHFQHHKYSVTIRKGAPCQVDRTKCKMCERSSSLSQNASICIMGLSCQTEDVSFLSTAYGKKIKPFFRKLAELFRDQCGKSVSQLKKKIEKLEVEILLTTENKNHLDERKGQLFRHLKK